MLWEAPNRASHFNFSSKEGSWTEVKQLFHTIDRDSDEEYGGLIQTNCSVAAPPAVPFTH